MMYRHVKLGKVADLKTGLPFKSTAYSSCETGLRLLRGDNIVQGRLRWDGVKWWPRDLVDEVEEYLLCEGDVVLAMDRPWIEAGLKHATIRAGDLPALLVQRVARIRGGRHLDQRFLHYVVSSAEFTDHVLTVQTGTAVPHISGRDISAFAFALPPLIEQQAIAAVLGALDDKIELNRRMCAKLEAMARALFRSWFVDFDPVRAKAEGQAPAHMDPATAALFPARFGNDGLPEGWHALRLQNALELCYGKSLPKGRRQGGPFPVYGSGGVTGSHTEALVTQPTVVVGRKGTVGTLYWAPHGCFPIDTTFFVRTKLPMVYVYRLLETLGLPDMNTDAAVPGLNRENAYRLEVPNPSAQLIDSYDAVAGAWQRLIDKRAHESASLATLRDALLPKLMSGELRVRDAERQLAEAV